MSGYIKNAKVKAGMFENKQVKAKDMIKYIRINYQHESNRILTEIDVFNFAKFNEFIELQELLTPIQKKWLKLIIPKRREYILEWFREED